MRPYRRRLLARLVPPRAWAQGSRLCDRGLGSRWKSPPSVLPPNGSRLSCGRLARQRKVVRRQPVRASAQDSASIKAITAGSFKRLLGRWRFAPKEVLARPQESVDWPENQAQPLVAKSNAPDDRDRRAVTQGRPRRRRSESHARGRRHTGAPVLDETCKQSPRETH